MTNRLLTGGAVGALLFVAVLLFEGATRPGYDAWVRYGSELSLSDQGWMQITNFIVCGLLIVLGASGLARALDTGPGATAGPLLVGLFGAGLVLAGIFTMDPRVGYPADVVAAAPKTLHGTLHGLAGLLCFSSVAAAALVLARRFWGTPWAIYSLVTGLVVAASFVAATASSVLDDTGVLSGAPTGLLQRVGIVAGWGWVALVTLRLRSERGGSLPLVTRLGDTDVLLKAGIVGPLLFIVVFLIESATRPDYNPLRSMVSELSLSQYGWEQIANFLVSGALIVAFAVGLRRALIAGPGATWGPRLLGITGLGLIVAGVFVCDPGLAYPAGAPDALPISGSWQNSLHGIGGMMVFFSLPAACLILARRFVGDPGWRNLAIYSLMTGVLGLAFFMACNISAMHGGPAGLFQRLCVGCYLSWMALLAFRLSRDGSGQSAVGIKRVDPTTAQRGDSRFRGTADCCVHRQVYGRDATCGGRPEPCPRAMLTTRHSSSWTRRLPCTPSIRA